MRADVRERHGCTRPYYIVSCVQSFEFNVSKHSLNSAGLSSLQEFSRLGMKTGGQKEEHELCFNTIIMSCLYAIFIMAKHPLVSQGTLIVEDS